jgi:hypothetical protein
MDPVTIQVVATGAFAVLHPYLVKAAGKAAEEVGKQLPASAGKLWVSIRKKLDLKAAGRESVDDILSQPDNPDVQAAFRVQIRKALEEDHVFTEQFRELVEKAQQESTDYHAEVNDGGAVAQGKNAQAVGTRGVINKGDGNIIITGDGQQTPTRGKKKHG